MSCSRTQHSEAGEAPDTSYDSVKVMKRETESKFQFIFAIFREKIELNAHVNSIWPASHT